jgi:hypothetical protein
MAVPLYGDRWDAFSGWLEARIGDKQGSNERVRKAVGWLRWIALLSTTHTEIAFVRLGHASVVGLGAATVVGQACFSGGALACREALRVAAPSIRSISHRIKLPPTVQAYASAGLERAASMGRWVALFVLSGGKVLVPNKGRSAEEIMAEDEAARAAEFE